MGIQHGLGNPWDSFEILGPRKRDQFKHVLKAGLVLDIEGGMLDPRLLIRILIDQIDIQILEISHPVLFSDFFDKDKEQAPCRFRIVVGHVVVLQAHSKALGQWSQAMTFKIWVEVTGKFQGIDDWLGDFWKTMTLIVGIHEAHVKGGIMGDEHSPLTEGLKLFQDLHQGLSSPDMFIGDACQLGRKGRQRMARVDKLIKLLNDIALVHLRSRNLDQVIVNG